MTSASSCRPCSPGVTNGFVYALVGMGLAAIFKGSRIINAMQGEFSVVGAMTTVLLLTKAGWPYWPAIARRRRWPGA